MALLLIRDLVYSLGALPLIDKAQLNVEPGERICLIGRNGTGKTTFLNLIRGSLTPDSGEFVRQPGLKIRMLEQEVPRNLAGSVYEVVTEGLGDDGRLLAQYRQASHDLGSGDEKAAKTLDRLQQELDRKNAWNVSRNVDAILTQMELDGDDRVETLSAGRKRRVLLCRALVSQPDILLLDEPTNHLDIHSIELIEQYLAGFAGGVVFVTHDREFLRRLATRIIELDRGALLEWNCGYDDYLVKREEYLQTQAKQVAAFQKKLAQEEVWIRTGIMARRTRNEGRVRALVAMREEARKIRQVEGVSRIQIQDAQVSGRLVIEAKDLTFAFPADEKHPTSRLIVENFSCRIMRSDRIGFIGPNGVGKTTLIRLLLNELTPQQGTIRHGTQIQYAYFDQLQEKLDFEATVIDNVTDGVEHVYINGQKKHILGYMEDFLFTNERAKDKVKFLSGGERNRLLLARLFLKPANVLIMDEPTNDLDSETLELLEEKLADFQGTLLVVSHDRAFLNNVVTSTIAMEGDGFVHQYDGGYDDYVRQRVIPPREQLRLEQERLDQQQKQRQRDEAARQSAAAKVTVSRPKLTYKEKMELDALPAKVEQLEQTLQTIDDEMAQPTFYQQQPEKIVEKTRQREQAQQQLDTLYERWEELEQKM